MRIYLVHSLSTMVIENKQACEAQSTQAQPEIPIKVQISEWKRETESCPKLAWNSTHTYFHTTYPPLKGSGWIPGWGTSPAEAQLWSCVSSIFPPSLHAHWFPVVHALGQPFEHRNQQKLRTDDHEGGSKGTTHCDSSQGPEAMKVIHPNTEHNAAVAATALRGLPSHRPPASKAACQVNRHWQPSVTSLWYRGLPWWSSV